MKYEVGSTKSEVGSHEVRSREVRSLKSWSIEVGSKKLEEVGSQSKKSEVGSKPEVRS